MVDIGSGVRPRILICDNEVALRGLVRAALDTGAYEVYEACDGDESLARALRIDPGFEQTPVVRRTGRAQASARAEAERAGATHFVTKPFSPLKLASIVAELVERAA